MADLPAASSASPMGPARVSKSLTVGRRSGEHDSSAGIAQIQVQPYVLSKTLRVEHRLMLWLYLDYYLNRDPVMVLRMESTRLTLHTLRRFRHGREI